EEATAPLVRAQAEDPTTAVAEARRVAKAVRQAGIARSEGQFNAGFLGLSAPVFDHEGAIAAALTVIGPAAASTEPEDPRLAALLQTAAGLSEALGQVPPG